MIPDLAFIQTLSRSSTNVMYAMAYLLLTGKGDKCTYRGLQNIMGNYSRLAAVQAVKKAVQEGALDTVQKEKHDGKSKTIFRLSKAALTALGIAGEYPINPTKETLND